MNTNPERDRFLADQALRFGEPIQAFALSKVLAGPPLGSELIFLLVGNSNLYLVPSAREASVFGIPLPGRKTAAPEPTTVPRAHVTEFTVVREPGWWGRLTGPQEVISVASNGPDGPAKWKFQMVGRADEFIGEWKGAWSEG